MSDCDERAGESGARPLVRVLTLPDRDYLHHDGEWWVRSTAVRAALDRRDNHKRCPYRKTCDAYPVTIACAGCPAQRAGDYYRDHVIPPGKDGAA